MYVCTRMAYDLVHFLAHNIHQLFIAHEAGDRSEKTFKLLCKRPAFTLLLPARFFLLFKLR